MKILEVGWRGGQKVKRGEDGWRGGQKVKRDEDG